MSALAFRNQPVTSGDLGEATHISRPWSLMLAHLCTLHLPVAQAASAPPGALQGKPGSPQHLCFWTDTCAEQEGRAHWGLERTWSTV